MLYGYSMYFLIRAFLLNAFVKLLVSFSLYLLFFVTLDSYNHIVNFINMDQSFHRICSSWMGSLDLHFNSWALSLYDATFGVLLDGNICRYEIISPYTKPRSINFVVSASPATASSILDKINEFSKYDKSRLSRNCNT